jgi:predicted CopG family antitoxin
MNKKATLSGEAYEVLMANREHARESLSSVIMRFVPRPIRTFDNLEKHWDSVGAQLQADFTVLERVRKRKRKANHAV